MSLGDLNPRVPLLYAVGERTGEGEFYLVILNLFQGPFL